MNFWIARDKNGFIGLYRIKPTWVRVNRFREDWDGEFIGLLDNNDFPEITFENSPKEVEFKLVKK